MCNLFRQRKTENLAHLFDARPLFEIGEPRVEIYPKYQAFVIRRQEGERVLDYMPWGILRTLPGKSGKPVQKAVTNVRNLDSPFWRSTIAKPEQRCLVPFTEFAEPKPGRDESGRPAQHWFHLPAREHAAFAGIWRFSEGSARFAFLTCEPNPLVEPLHPKAMPVILHEEDHDAWLDGTAQDACALALPIPSQLMAVA
jgi:putative SOS response-associated peptidase YedK